MDSDYLREHYRGLGHLSLVEVPEEEQQFIKDTCQDDFDWDDEEDERDRTDEETRHWWLEIMEIVCGKDKRYLPCYSDNDFYRSMVSFITSSKTSKGNDSGKMFGYIQDSLNCLLGEVIEKGYYHLAENIGNVMTTLEIIARKYGKEDIPVIDGKAY